MVEEEKKSPVGLPKDKSPDLAQRRKDTSPDDPASPSEKASPSKTAMEEPTPSSPKNTEDRLSKDLPQPPQTQEEATDKSPLESYTPLTIESALYTQEIKVSSALEDEGIIHEVDEEHAHDNQSEMHRHQFMRSKEPSENQEGSSSMVQHNLDLQSNSAEQ